MRPILNKLTMVCFGATLFIVNQTVSAATVDCATVLATPAMLCHPYISPTEPDNTATCTKQCTINLATQVNAGSYGGGVVSAGTYTQYNNTCPARYTLLGVRFLSGNTAASYFPTSMVDMGTRTASGWKCTPSSTQSGPLGVGPVAADRGGQWGGPTLPGSYIQLSNAVYLVDTVNYTGLPNCTYAIRTCWVYSSGGYCNANGSATNMWWAYAGSCSAGYPYVTCACDPPGQSVMGRRMSCSPPSMPDYASSGVPLLIAVCGYSGATYTPLAPTSSVTGCGTVPGTNPPASVDSTMVCPPVLTPVLFDAGSSQTPTYQ